MSTLSFTLTVKYRPLRRTLTLTLKLTHVDANAQGSDVKAYLMDLHVLNALEMKFDIGRKMASSRSGGRLHVLASYGGHRVEVDLHFGSSV